MSRRVDCGLWLVALGTICIGLFSGCSSKKTAAPPPAPTTPAPKFLGEVILSPSFGEVRQGQTFSIIATVQNQGTDSDSGMISIGFPQFTDTADVHRVTSPTVGAQPGNLISRKGDPLLGLTCQTDTAHYAEAQYFDDRWLSGKSNTYTVEITPRASGIFTFLIRSALRVPGKGCLFVTAVPGNGLGTQTDQQGFPAAQFQVSVIDSSADSANVLQQRLVQAGTFQEGSPLEELGRGGDEGNLGSRAVSLTRPFFLLDHEVSQTEWQTVMGWNYSANQGAWLPVDNITFYDALSYCNLRSQREGLTPAYAFLPTLFDSVEVIIPRTGLPDSIYYQRTQSIVAVDTVLWHPEANGYRLPTEAEWEYACRAGNSSAFYSGGISTTLCTPLDPALDPIGWYCGNSGSQTMERSQAVARKQRNAWGFYDMSGNISEWCWDIYGPYLTQSGPILDPTGPASESPEFRVVRGGSWNSSPDRCRSAARDHAVPGGKSDIIGFRVARNAS